MQTIRNCPMPSLLRRRPGTFEEAFGALDGCRGDSRPNATTRRGLPSPLEEAVQSNHS